MRLDQLHKLMSRAMREGARAQGDMPNVLEWDVSGSCLTPSRTVLHARGEQKAGDNARFRVNPGSASMFMTVPCRKCEACLKYKGRLWYFRARAEIVASPRTWFGSLTMSTENHFRDLCQISIDLRKQGVSPSEVSDTEMFRLRAKSMGRHFTDYMKRLRKSGAVLRYVLVTEAHKSGLPHLHVLLHECTPDNPVRKSVLQEQWPLGFSSFKLVESDPRAAAYVTKYISKSMMARVRASLNYGAQGSPKGIASESESVIPVLY